MLALAKEILVNGYLWIKAFHIIAMVCWFAALFYLPRLFVYHAMAQDLEGRERFKVMERKLYRGIATPSMVATIVLGLAMAATSANYFFSATWFWVKIALVVLLVIYHFSCRYFLRQFQNDANTRNHVFYRWFNEAPVLLLIGTVVMVVVKPF
jgi:protoporphyrinogen IX oxidase